MLLSQFILPSPSSTVLTSSTCPQVHSLHLPYANSKILVHPMFSQFLKWDPSTGSQTRFAPLCTLVVHTRFYCCTCPGRCTFIELVSSEPKNSPRARAASDSSLKPQHPPRCSVEFSGFWLFEWTNEWRESQWLPVEMSMCVCVSTCMCTDNHRNRGVFCLIWKVKFPSVAFTWTESPPRKKICVFILCRKAGWHHG